MKFFARVFPLLVAATYVAANKLSLTPTGKTYTIGNLSYFAPPNPVAKFSASLTSAGLFSSISQSSGGELVPFSVFVTDHPDFGASALSETIDAWFQVDDVFSSVFLTGELPSQDFGLKARNLYLSLSYFC